MTDLYLTAGILCAGSTLVMARGVAAAWHRMDKVRKVIAYCLIACGISFSLPTIATPWSGFPPMWLVIAAVLIAGAQITIGLNYLRKRRCAAKGA